MRDDRARDFVLTDYARSLIRFKARQLSRRPGFNRSDQDDLEQELTLRLLRQAHKFDPRRASLDTFVDRVVNSEVAMLLRAFKRQKRAGDRTAQSLDAEARSRKELTSLAGAVSEQDAHRRHGTVPRNAVNDIDNAEALEQALRAMPPEISHVCRRVMGGSISSAAEETGRSRHSIRSALQDAVPFLERAGFGKPADAPGQPRPRRHK